MTEAPTIGPGNGYELFEELESWDFFGAEDKETSNVFGCDFDSLRETTNSLWMSSPFRWRPFSDPFSFLASTSLSGAGDPCFHLDCRLDRALALGRFAALYAETVLIRDPFERVLHDDDSRKLRLDFANTLFVLRLLRPAIQAGIVAFAPTDFPFCEDDQRVFRQVELEVRNRVLAACKLLLDDVVQNLDVRVCGSAESSYLSIDGIEKYVPHASIDLVPTGSTQLWVPGLVPTNAQVRDAVQTWILDPSVIDLQYQHIINWLYNARYLTDRPIDTDLLCLLDERPRAAHRPHLGARMSHALPFVDGLDAETLLKLRKEEGEAFRAYRDRVRSLVEDTTLSQREFQESFRDLVEPELNKIDHSVAAVKKMVKASIREKLVFGTGMVTIGLAAGAVTPEVGAVISALGGAKFGSDLLTSLNALLREPEVACRNDFYFLWKARNHAAHQGRPTSETNRRPKRGRK